MLLPGYSDELAYDLGLIVRNGSFSQTKEAAKVNFKAYLYRDDPDFSRKIRQPQLPAPGPLLPAPCLLPPACPPSTAMLG